ncbi:MAG: hypothetical protein ACHQPH_19375 [Reyranellales bacterium]
MQFRAAIEHDAEDLQELAERAARASGHSGFPTASRFAGDDHADQERQLDAAAMDLRRHWLQVAHRPADATLKSPCDGEVARMPVGQTVRFGYEREIDISSIERRGEDYLDRLSGWTSEVVLFRSGQAALAGLLHFVVNAWGGFGAVTVAHAGAYFETASLLKSWPGRVLRPSDGEADIVIAEPVWCNGAFSCSDTLPAARRLLILDTTLAGPGCDLRSHLQEARCPLVIAYSSGLKLDQAGLELANVGIVRLYARRDVQSVAAALRSMRSLVGAGLTLDEMSALSAPWFMDRGYADRYVSAVFANNCRLAAAIGARSPVFAPRCHPSLHRQGADAPFCALQLNEPSPQAYRTLERLVELECERRDIVITKGGSFGFRGHRFELIEPQPGQGEPFLRVAMGWRDGWSCRRLCALFAELAQGR